MGGGGDRGRVMQWEGGGGGFDVAGAGFGGVGKDFLHPAVLQLGLRYAGDN